LERGKMTAPAVEKYVHGANELSANRELWADQFDPAIVGDHLRCRSASPAPADQRRCRSSERRRADDRRPGAHNRQAAAEKRGRLQA